MTQTPVISRIPSSLLKQIEEDIFFTKDDLKDPRLGDFVSNLVHTSPAHKAVELIQQKQPDLVILGYPDDEGIRLNGGRAGAQSAPLEIRKSFYKMTPHLKYTEIFQIVDLGDVSTEIPLSDRHLVGQYLAESICDQKNTHWISLGGGHDYGYADGSGFIKSCLKKNQRPLIINFDAHLDVRPNDKSSNSGTPFYRLLTEFENQFDLLEIGLQPQCNSRFHWQWAQSKKAQLIAMSDIEKNFLSQLQKNLTASSDRPLFISLDMDVITSSEAPGCSQSWVSGVRSQEIFDCITWLCQSFQCKGLGIYEVSPPLDRDNQTSKLAALFAHHYFFNQLSLNS